MAHDPVNHPSHYTQGGGIECIDYIRQVSTQEEFVGFCLNNTRKYLHRYKDKNGVEDLKKAAWYLDRAIKEVTNENNQGVSEGM